MNIKVRRKRIFIVITCTISTLLIAVISALPMYLHECEVMPVHTCPEPELMPVRDIQIALRDMGYLDADEIDGIWCNQRMIDAWKAWERNNIDESVIFWMKEMEIK